MPHRITMLNLEFNSSCNLRCQWCALDHTKPRHVMSKETLETVLHDLADGALPGLRRIDLHNGGETLLHPDLPGMLSVLAEWLPRLPQKPTVALLTNAMLLTERKGLAILNSSAIDILRFSIDGGTPALYESIRHGARWRALERNLLRFLAQNTQFGHPVATEGICMVPEGHSEPFSPEFTALLNKLDKVTLRHPHNWDGSVELNVDDRSYRAIAAERSTQVCFLLERNLVILPDGSVTVCCNDLNARGVIGNIHETGLAAVAASPQRTTMRNAMERGERHTIPLCQNCTGFFTQ